MQRHHPRRSAQVAASLALAALLLLGACSSSPGEPTPTTKVDPLPRENTTYLLSIGWEKGQAVCVSRLVKVDLKGLLSAPDGGAVLPQIHRSFEAGRTRTGVAPKQGIAQANRYRLRWRSDPGL